MLVDLRQRLSSLTPDLHRLIKHGTKSSTPAPRPASPARTVKSLVRLTDLQRAELIELYRAGQTVYQLADKYGIHRRTISKHLRSAGVRLRLDGLTIEQIDEAEQLYASGQSLARIADILRTKTGNDFHGYKQNTFLRRVQRRMQVVQIDEIGAYVDFLRTDKDEAQNLFNDLLIGVTEFFRDKREFEVLETQVIPKIFEDKGAGQQVRVWVLGCATGEEAYSIGILLREQPGRRNPPQDVQSRDPMADTHRQSRGRIFTLPRDAARSVSVG